LLSTYTSEVTKLTQLTNTVLAHHKKDPQQYLVQVVGDDVKILPKSAVAEKDRLPKPVSSMRLSYLPDPYPTSQNQTTTTQSRGQFNMACMEQEHRARQYWGKADP